MSLQLIIVIASIA